MAYLCEGCGAHGHSKQRVEHKDGCEGGLRIKKVCMKSGKDPHLP